MPNPFSRAADLAIRVARKNTQTPITIRRGELSAAIAAAGVGSTIFELEDLGEGVATRFESKDFLVATSEYDFGSGPVDPAEHDLIEEIDERLGRLITYEVSAPPPEQPWRWMDRWRGHLRIHTKRVSETPIEEGSGSG